MYDPSYLQQPLYHPQYYEASSQNVYRPQMYETGSPQMFVSQPMPSLAKHFDPFETRVEVDDDDNEDDDEAVPETQPNEDEEAEEIEVQQVAPEVRTRPKKADKKQWTPDEEEALAKSWLKISVDKQVGDRQTKEGFWRRVLKHFESLVPGTVRTKDQVNSKWGVMNPAIVAFNGYYEQAVYFI